MNKQTLQVNGAVSLALRVYEPEGAPRASVVIGGAMGVRQSYYEAFALWMAQQGFPVTTFDYRGHGDSLQGAMRDVKADLFDWAQDYEAVISAAKAALPSQPLYLLGHSLGAQLPGLLKKPEQVAGLLSVAAGSGCWGDPAVAALVSGPCLQRGGRGACGGAELWRGAVPGAGAVDGGRRAYDLARHAQPGEPVRQHRTPGGEHHAGRPAGAAHWALWFLSRPIPPKPVAARSGCAGHAGRRRNAPRRS